MKFRRRERRLAESGPYYRQRGWQMSAGFLAVVVVVGGVVTALSGSDATTGRANAAASEGPLSRPSAPQDGRPRGCRTDDGADAESTETAPEDVTWRPLGVTKVPVSASAGPTLIQGPLWWCYAHTPTGAVLAAHVIPSHMSGSDWRTVTEQQVVAGQGRDMFEFQRATVRDTDAPNGAEVASYAGFSVVSYEDTAAVIRLLLKSTQGYAVTTVSLRWSGGDWKVRPDDNGSLHSPVSAVQSAGGFTLWGGTT
ncbi:hypothetical protein [Streptomyces antibioticus]|uniref:DUF8175 domain-containing protein n=1 Tax=Streptomyces antibioticus TaxID=1890 RepID=A0AAE6YAP7_STRAT|nr:hypothetical protein [Streptomyces antibioticus]MCX4737466.1 hypothetical protein [Streptomyces antibioticus]OOQ49022.1 hypothetical protein AFM16_22315 [Streptomyces antibioticus]QIT45987.1 hypothetical protein HCX60_22720 [Streptomyces antibioticus]